jgi:predicted Fe-Mo cluster-binding NifX family protein
MIVATPVDSVGNSAKEWGRAHWVAVAEVIDDVIVSWSVDEVAWDASHDEGSHGSDHARIATYLRDKGVQAIVLDLDRPPMIRMLAAMGIPTLPPTQGNAKASVLAAVAAASKEQ